MKRLKTGRGNPEKTRPDESKFQEGPNPLLNYAVLSELMSYLPVPDLRHCRLVNSAWRAAATPHLKKNSWLRSYKTFPRSHHVGLANKGAGSSKYLDDLCFSKQRDPNRDRKLRELGLFGFQSFRIHLPPFLKSSSAKETLLKFLEDYGADFRNVVFEMSAKTLELLGTALTSLPNLVSLSINFETDSGHAIVWHVWPSSTLPRGVPSIKRIKFGSRYSRPERRGSINSTNHYNFLKRLLQIAPNLETLKFQNSLRVESWSWDNHRRCNVQSEDLYLQLLKDEGMTLCPHLKDLNWCGTYDDDRLSTWDMELILQLDFNFRQLVLPWLMYPDGYHDFGEPIKDVRPFILTLLDRHQSSLEVFEFRMSSAVMEDDNSSFHFKFPSLQKLRKLRVEYNLDDKYDPFYGLVGIIRFDPVDYATQFPALKDLSLFYNASERGENRKRFDGRIDFYNQFFPDNGQVCPTLQRLTVEVLNPVIRIKKSWTMNAAYLQFSYRLALMFPNVHNHEEVKACRTAVPTDLDDFVANEARRVTRSMTQSFKSAIGDQVGN